MSGFDANGRPILNPEANYGKTGKGFYLVGFPVACVESDVLQPGYRVGLHADQLRQLSATSPRRAPRWATSCCRINIAKHPEGPPPKVEGPGSYLLAWDPVKQKAAWVQRRGHRPLPAP